MPDREDVPEVSPRARLGLLSSVGIMFPVAIALGGGAGYYLDRWLGTFPWMTIVFFIFGIIAAFINLFRIVKLFDKPVKTD